MCMMNSAKSTLDESTLWRIKLKLQKQGFKESSAIVRVRFIEARGYEPPQGRIFVEDDLNGVVNCDDKGYSGTWTLSEDKNDRKDGLWIWGLFEEPKYPYLYFYLDIFNSTILASGEEEPIFGGDGVPNNRLNIRLSHNRDPIKGVILSNGEMTYQMTEFMKADPFGIGGQVNVGDIINAGKIDIRPAIDEALPETSKTSLK